MLAVANGHTETVKYLVENTAIMINVTDDVRILNFGALLEDVDV